MFLNKETRLSRIYCLHIETDARSRVDITDIHVAFPTETVRHFTKLLHPSSSRSIFRTRFLQNGNMAFERRRWLWNLVAVKSS